MNKDHREIGRKLRVLEHDDGIGSVSITCRYLGIAVQVPIDGERTGAGTVKKQDSCGKPLR